MASQMSGRKGSGTVLSAIQWQAEESDGSDSDTGQEPALEDGKETNPNDLATS